MKKLVYVVTKTCTTMSGDDFNLYYTFDLEDARKALAREADRGYNLNRQSPDKVKYIIFGYEVDTDGIDDNGYNEDDAKSLLSAYIDSQCCVDHIFDEEWARGTRVQETITANFKILTSARRIHPQRSHTDEGHIVEYDGDLFFVFEPDEGYDIHTCEYWTLDVENHFCVDEVDTDFYRYKTLDNKPLNMEDLR